MKTRYLPQSFSHMLASSFLADASVSKDCVFELGQGINMKDEGAGHGLYILSFLLKFQGYVNQSCLRLSKSVSLKKAHCGLNFS